LSARAVVEKLFGQLQGELLSGTPLFRNQVDPGELLIEISAIAKDDVVDRQSVVKTAVFVEVRDPGRGNTVVWLP